MLGNRHHIHPFEIISKFMIRDCKDVGLLMYSNPTKTYPPTMKLKSKLIAASSIIALATCPLAMADGAADGKDASPEAPEVIEEVIIDDQIVDEDEIVEITVEPGDGTIVECEPGVECETGAHEGEVEPGDRDVPIDWVKRGGEELENPDVIFQTTMDGGGAPVALKGDIDLGQDDKAAGIVTKGGAAAPQIKREKKGPVALVKKGRVFLR